MTLCPIAMVSGCKRCFAVAFCPLKTVLGDYKESAEAESKQDAQPSEKKDESA